MNALSRPVVVSKIWLQCGSDPPECEARLSTGAYLLVRWDSDYSHPVILKAGNGVADFASIPARESGLSVEALDELVEEVKRAVECHESNERAEYMGDAMSVEDGR